MAETAKQKKAREAAEAAAANQNNLPATTNNVPLYNFKTEKVDEDSGEVLEVDLYRYVEGYPRGYRCDAKTGTFNIVEGAKLEGNSFSFQPIAWRFFSDDIMALGLKFWVEIFFVDEKNNVSAIMFHSSTAENLERLAMPLFYEDISLMDTIITCEMKEHTNEKVAGKPKYWIGEFSYERADPDKVKEMKAFVKTVKLYRRSTLTENADVKAEKNFFNPFFQEEPAQIAAMDENV